MSEEINFDDVEFGEPIEEREPNYRDGYIRGIYRARNIIDSKQKEIERLNSIINNDFSKICREKMIDKLSANEMILLQDKEIERLQRQKEELQVNGLRQETLFKLEIERLNNIINEFETLIKHEITESIFEDNYGRVDAMEYCLATLRELKGDDKE